MAHRGPFNIHNNQPLGGLHMVTTHGKNKGKTIFLGNYGNLYSCQELSENFVIKFNFI